VDARLHHLQGKTELVTDTLPLLQEFYRDKLAAYLRHVAGSRLVGQYDVNNTYQYIVNRDDVQLTWLAEAIQDLGGSAPEAGEPSRETSGKPKDVVRSVLEEDGRDAQSFVERWRPRVEAMTHARHRTMLRILLGEVLEQKRFFDLALDGRTDLLGRRGAVLGPSHGEVLPSRWIE
jgi:hypothetical protein